MRTFNHKTKSQRKREALYKAVRTVDYEPTVDDSLQFPSSDDKKSDYSTPTEQRTRPPKMSERISDHVKEHWIAWLVGAIAAVMVLSLIHI